VSEPSPDQTLLAGTNPNITSAPPSRLTDVDFESFVASDLLDPAEMQRLRELGLTGRAYYRYLSALDINSEQLMSQLAACGVSSYTYESFREIGVTDVLRVCRLHLEGWTAESYGALLKDLRQTFGRALYERALRCHHAPDVTLAYVKSSVKFADWLLFLSEKELESVIAKCEADDPGIAHFDEE
jgi:hypothetical protein